MPSVLKILCIKLQQGCLFVFEQHFVALQLKKKKTTTLLCHCIIVVIMFSSGHIKLSWVITFRLNNTAWSKHQAVTSPNRLKVKRPLEMENNVQSSVLLSHIWFKKHYKKKCICIFRHMVLSLLGETRENKWSTNCSVCLIKYWEDKSSRNRPWE